MSIERVLGRRRRWAVSSRNELVFDHVKADENCTSGENSPRIGGKRSRRSSEMSERQIERGAERGLIARRQSFCGFSGKRGFGTRAVGLGVHKNKKGPRNEHTALKRTG